MSHTFCFAQAPEKSDKEVKTKSDQQACRVGDIVLRLFGGQQLVVSTWCEKPRELVFFISFIFLPKIIFRLLLVFLGDILIVGALGKVIHGEWLL